jgi:hypothetical protein
MKRKYLMIATTLITTALADSAWSQQDDKLRPPAAPQTRPSQINPSERGLCDDYPKDSLAYRQCLKVSEPCCAMHGRAYEACCEGENEGSVCCPSSRR